MILQLFVTMVHRKNNYEQMNFVRLRKVSCKGHLNIDRTVTQGFSRKVMQDLYARLRVISMGQTDISVPRRDLSAAQRDLSVALNMST